MPCPVDVSVGRESCDCSISTSVRYEQARQMLSSRLVGRSMHSSIATKTGASPGVAAWR